MPNQLAELLKQILKHERVIQDDLEEISTIIGKSKNRTENTKG
jgi:ferritin